MPHLQSTIIVTVGRNLANQIQLDAGGNETVCKVAAHIKIKGVSGSNLGTVLFRIYFSLLFISTHIQLRFLKSQSLVENYQNLHQPPQHSANLNAHTHCAVFAEEPRALVVLCANFRVNHMIKIARVIAIAFRELA